MLTTKLIKMVWFRKTIIFNHIIDFFFLTEFNLIQYFDLKGKKTLKKYLMEAKKRFKISAKQML